MGSQNTQAPSGPTPHGTGDNGRTTSVTFLPLRSLKEMKPMERRQAMQVSRFICNRLGLGRGLVEGCTRYSVGAGIVGYAATGDDKFDDAANRYCDSVFESADFDVSGENNFYEMQEIVCPAMMTDGDCGVGKILQRDESGQVLYGPQLQLFTSDQIANGITAPSVPSSDYYWEEGVLYGPYKRRHRYRVIEEARPGMSLPSAYTDFDARDFMLVLDPKRINMGRGMPWLHHGGNSCINMIDLVELEKAAAYLNSYFSAVITTPTGEVPEMFDTMLTGEEAPEEVDPAQRLRAYANFLGGAGIPVLKEGEKLEIVKNERPSLTFTGFLDWLVNDIAWGFGVPPQFVWTLAGVTGPNARLILSQSDAFFRMIIRRMVSRYCKPVRDWVLRYGLITGKINGGRPPKNGADYRLCRWHGPRKITIDEGREGKLAMDRVLNGFGTEEEYHAERGQDGDTVARARIREIKKRMKWCEEDGVPIELYYGSVAKPGLILSNPEISDAEKSDQLDEEEARTMNNRRTRVRR